MLMKKLAGIWILLFFLFSSRSLAQGVAIGINNYLLKIYIPVNSYRISYIGVTNPSPYDLRAKIYFDCDTCVSDLKLFGFRIGETLEIPSQYFTIGKKDVFVPNHTLAGIPIPIYIHPKLLLIKKLRVRTPDSINFLVQLLNPRYQGKIDISYPTLLIGNKLIKGRIVVNVYWSSFGGMGVSPAVASVFELHVKGMPLGSFLTLLLAFFTLLLLFFYKLRGKTLKFKFGLKRKRKKSFH